MIRPAMLTLFGLALAACGSDDDDHHHDAHESEDPAEHACEHLDEAPLELVATPDDAPPELELERLSRVALPAGEPGFVVLVGPLDALLFADTANVVSGLSRVGSSAELLPEGEPNEHCPQALPEHFDLQLGAGSFRLRLGPSVLDSVQLLLTSSDGHGHD